MSTPIRAGVCSGIMVMGILLMTYHEDNYWLAVIGGLVFTLGIVIYVETKP